MKKYFWTFYRILIIIPLFFFQFCSNDSGTESDTGGNNPSSANYGIILGTVKSVYGSGLAGVEVSGNGYTATTNDQGWFSLEDIPPAERFQLTFALEEYVVVHKVVDILVGETTYIDVILVSRATGQPVSGASGGLVFTGGATVTFPPGSFNGEGAVYANYFDPTSSNYNYNEIFPGSFEGIPEGGGGVAALESYGFMDIELKNPSGNNIPLADEITLTMPIPVSMQEEAPQTMPLWYYDTNESYWKEEGSAVKAGNTYVGKVSHLTSWNLDITYSFAYLTGRVIDENGDPITGAYVSADGVDYNGRSYRYTDSDGSFTIGVRPNSTVKVKAAKSGVESVKLTVYTPAANQTYTIRDIVLAPPVVTITLTWDITPYDLDSHLLIPSSAGYADGHVYFSDKGSSVSYPYAVLDTDDRNSYGPEVITIYRKYEGQYLYYVHNWSGEENGSLVQSEAKVQLIMGGNIYNFDIPVSGNSDNRDSWHVFDLVVDGSGNFQVSSINEFRDEDELLGSDAVSKISKKKK